MKKAIIRFSMFVFLIFFAQVSPVFAHPADLYVHSIYVTLAKDRLSIKWELKPGPMLVSFIWFEADTNMDDTVSAEEAQRWASSRVPLLTATFDGGQFPLQLDDLQFPSSRNTFQSGAETITIHLSAVWPQYRNNSYKLMLHNGLEEQKSISWYYITGQDGIEFQTPEQKNNIIALQIFEPSAQAFAQIPLRTDWDSSMPSLSLIQKGQEQDQQTTKSQATKRSLSDFVPSGKNTPQDILVNLVRQGQLSISFYLFALGVSLFLGALHALTPGHGKTVVAAYLVGSRGTSWHAVGLGTVVTLTHTGSVFLLGIITLVASRYILPTTLIPMFEIVSGLLIVGLGIYLFRQRFGQWRKAGASLTAQKTGTRKYSLNPVTSAGRIPSAAHRIQPVHTHAHGQGYMHDHGDGHFHSHDVPEMITWRSLIALGISGGLVPCPDAVAILLVAIAINRIVLGLALITSFSLGLAVVLIVIGLLMVNSRRLFDRVGIFERYAPILPMVSAFIVLALGAVLTVGALAQVKENLNLTGSISGSMNEAQVIYLAGGQDQVKQLFIADAYHPNPVLLSDATDNVVEYALSPDGTRAVYIVQTENLENRLWMVDLKSGARNQLTDCDNAICSRPVWSPDGKLIVYEYTRLSGNNLTGTSTLWQLDVGTGEAKPVFQEENLPGRVRIGRRMASG